MVPIHPPPISHLRRGYSATAIPKDDGDDNRGGRSEKQYRTERGNIGTDTAMTTMTMKEEEGTERGDQDFAECLTIGGGVGGKPTPSFGMTEIMGTGTAKA